MPWVCAVGSTAYVTWYDRRFAIPGVTTDFTDFFGGSASLDMSNTLVAGPEFRISTASDPNCASGWPCAPRATGDSESCQIQPQLAGVCLDGTGAGSQQRCDFTSGPACPAGESCMLGGGCPKYGDYNGNACAGGRLFMAWASATAPTGVTPSTGIDTFTDSRVVCCVPQIQTAGALNFGATCSTEPVTRDLEICNQGKTLLQVTNITSSSTRYSVATPVPGFPMDIAAGNCQTLQVTFNPNAPGTVNATLSIASNDPAFPTATVQLTGSAGAPDISVTGNGSFGNVCSTASEQHTIDAKGKRAFQKGGDLCDAGTRKRADRDHPDACSAPCHRMGDRRDGGGGRRGRSGRVLSPHRLVTGRRGRVLGVRPDHSLFVD